jgi:hypothetical protein
MVDGILLFRVVGTIVIVVVIVDMRGRDADKQNFTMGSPNATMYHLHGVGLILDNHVHVDYCGGAANLPLVRAGGGPAEADAGGSGEGTGRPATDTGVESTAPALARAGNADPELLVVGGD